MTRTKARAIATSMNAWRRDHTGRLLMPFSSEFGLAIDVLTQPCTIAENIRNAAINWPVFLGDVESQIVYTFWACNENAAGTSEFEWRWFLLFIAEELES